MAHTDKNQLAFAGERQELNDLLGEGRGLNGMRY